MTTRVKTSKQWGDGECFAAKVGEKYFCISYYAEVLGTLPSDSHETWLRCQVTDIFNDRLWLTVEDGRSPMSENGEYMFDDEDAMACVRPTAKMEAAAKEHLWMED